MDWEELVWAKKSVGRFLDCLSDPLYREVIEAAMSGMTLGQICQETQLSKQRVQQVYGRALHRMKVIARKDQEALVQRVTYQLYNEGPKTDIHYSKVCELVEDLLDPQPVPEDPLRKLREAYAKTETEYSWLVAGANLDPQTAWLVDRAYRQGQRDALEYR